MTHITQSQKQQIADLRAAGVSFVEIAAQTGIRVNGCRNARQSGGKGIAQNYGFARHGGLERSPKGEFQDPHGVAAQFLGCGVVICV